MLNRLRVEPICYRILIFGSSNRIAATLTLNDITQLQVSSIYNKGFAGNYNPTAPSYMASDYQIMNVINEAFAAERRPDHFTNYTHCCECAEHDELLRARDRETLVLEDVGNPGWDPICFVTAEGFRYYLPALVRLAFGTPHDQNAGPYLSQLLFHLIGDGEKNRRVVCCSPAQRRAVVGFLWHVVSTRDCSAEGCGDDLLRAIDIWSDGTA